MEEPVASSKNQEREAREARDRLKRYNARQAVHAHQTKRRTRDNLIAVAGVLVVAALATTTQLFYFNGGPGTPPTPTPAASDAATGSNTGDVPSTDVAEAREWTGELDLNKVAMTFTLDGVNAPQGVASFVTDVQNGYYLDAGSCHRVLAPKDAGSLIQCGSADGTGASDPNYAYGPIENAPADGMYPAGTIAIARPSNNAYGNGHQFFIVTQDIGLPSDEAGGYTVIGHVTSGIEDLYKQIVSKGVADGTDDGTPTVTTVITNVTVK
jgi:peptidyl-prolyl cis-trans isomerase B (cyclophilin B)